MLVIIVVVKAMATIQTLTTATGTSAVLIVELFTRGRAQRDWYGVTVLNVVNGRVKQSHHAVKDVSETSYQSSAVAF
ncbi:uncharacterized protein LOC110246872 [Exaiptasia diaphana]|uniref:Uncharacterized protein n=1 Tax=Exaiptasia diaphana TaxID=2652724 RepID=A0A913XR55_EXADI|nr:uncharacterized protein LOC110246872 [Exaiptasia diaphana]